MANLNSAAANTINMTAGNPDLENQALMYVGTETTFQVGLSNDTGGTIQMGADSYLQVFLPTFFTNQQVAAMSITAVSQKGWSTVFDDVLGCWTFKWTSDVVGVWKNGETLSFKIGNMLTQAQPTTDSIQVNFNLLQGSNIPLQTQVNVLLQNTPPVSSAKLTEVLEVELLGSNTVFVSSPSNALTNILYLNFKNIGKDPLYNGKVLWSGNPTVTVTFVYGSTSGALAPDDKQGAESQGSAWAITAAPFAGQGNSWTVNNPSATSGANSPAWTLKPASTNLPIIGTGELANVSFNFNQIISFTPPGATQMLVSFTGFMKDETTKYEDAFYVVSLNKAAPPAAGMIDVWCTNGTTVDVDPATQSAVFPMAWSMFNVGSVKLEFTYPDGSSTSKTISYQASHPALNYDSLSVTLDKFPYTTSIVVTAYAYPGTVPAGPPINSRQTTVFAVFPPKINSFTIQTTKIPPGASYAFLLQWDIQGAASRSITANDGTTQPFKLQIPDGATSFVVTPTAPQTTYTLDIYGTAPQKTTAPKRFLAQPFKRKKG